MDKKKLVGLALIALSLGIQERRYNRIKRNMSYLKVRADIVDQCVYDAAFEHIAAENPEL